MTQEKGDTGPSQVSRRGFLKGVSAGAALAAGTGPAAPAARRSGSQDEEPRVVGPGPLELTLNVNGKDRKLSVEPRVTLLDALRDRLDLTGAKKVCDRATCGACTVLLDGRPVYACSVLALEAEGHRIETIESLGQPGSLSPLQQAIWDNDGQQCGFCTPGFVVTATAALREDPALSPEDSLKALHGNLCRCGTYAGLRAALRQVADGGQKGGGQ